MRLSNGGLCCAFAALGLLTAALFGMSACQSSPTLLLHPRRPHPYVDTHAHPDAHA